MKENLKEISILENKKYIPEGEKNIVTVELITDLFHKDKIAMLSWNKDNKCVVLEIPIDTVTEVYKIINKAKRMKKKTRSKE